MAWWYSRGLSIWELSLAFVFMALTIFATMGTGEHYFVDLVVAFPFILFLQGLCTVSLEWSDSRRLVPLVFGLVTPLVWLWALRFHPQVFWYSPAIPWACCVGTIAAAELARRGMKDAAVGMNEPGRVSPLTAPTAVAELVH
jgi:PAP2 superfamily